MSDKQYYDFLCACGCGGRIEIKQYHSKKGYKIPKYILGHFAKTDEHKKQLKDRMKGHIPWNKGKKCPQISESHMGEKNPMYGKLGKDNPNFGRKASRETRKKQSDRKKGDNNPKYWLNKNRDDKTKDKISDSVIQIWQDKNSIYHTERYKNKLLKNRRRRTIEYIFKKYPFFSKIEEMRYKSDKKEIQVHCKNHNCINSKEKDGWFTPTSRQVESRIDALENKGSDLSYFYCCDKCKDECPLYYSRGHDPFKDNKKLYTQEEYYTFRKFVLERDEYKCQFCGEKATDVHHERPQKLEPFFALDPDFAWSCCKKCHYEKGHKTGTECSTGNLAKIYCEGNK